MPEIDVAQLKIASSALHNRRREYSNLLQADASERAQILANRRAIGKSLEEFFTKAGLDVDKLNKMVAKNQTESRGIFQKQRAGAAKYFSSAKDTVRHQIESRRKALEHLATRPTTLFAPVTLEPFLIWQTPHINSGQFIDSHLGALNEPWNNWVKIKIDTNSGSDDTYFIFYFMWENESDYTAVVNVASSLVLNGTLYMSAATGFFSGDICNLLIQARLSLLEWWHAPVTEPMFQMSQLQLVEDLYVAGGGLFGQPDHKFRYLPSIPLDLSFKEWIIPKKSLAIFEVSLEIQYQIQNGGNISDEIIVDLANNDLGYNVLCPSVTLEILTAPLTTA